MKAFNNKSQTNDGGITCFCINCPNPNDDEEEVSSCRLKEGAKCFAAMEEQLDPETNELEVVYSAGCFAPNDQSILQCEGWRVPSHYRRIIKCCSFTDYCNKNILPSSFEPAKNVTPPNIALDNFLLAPMTIFASIFVTVAVISILIMVCLYRKKKGSRKRVTDLLTIKVPKFNNNTHNYMQTSGSGDGQQLLRRRTIGREVKKERFLGKGRFSEKWVVNWKGDKIVMKTFTTLEEDQWTREKSIYATGLNHVNVLGFICSDYMENGLRANFIYYHKNGSLQDYIKHKCLNDKEFLTFARTAANGVRILHTEIRGTHTRPSIVHRNITSKNFLINDQGECEICDFEVALMKSETFDPKADFRVGTPRYSAPEIVDEAIHSFEEFKMADVYSLGLVLWELCRRSIAVSEDYALPFADILPEYPTMRNMKDIFVTAKPIHKLLGIPDSSETNKLLSALTQIVKECTNEISKSRPAAVRIFKHLKDLEIK